MGMNIPDLAFFRCVDRLVRERWLARHNRSSDDLTLDWDGFRSDLFEKGIDFRIGYVSETATNVQGGDEQLWRYSGQLTFAGTFDLQKLLGLDQAQFKVTITDRNGRDLSADANLDSLQQVQEIYGRGQTWRWTQFYYDQKYIEGTLDWKVGRLDPGEDFAAFSCEFMNLTFCGSTPGNIVGDYWYNWPVSQWATRLKASFDGFGYLQLERLRGQSKVSVDPKRIGSRRTGRRHGGASPFRGGLAADVR